MTNLNEVTERALLEYFQQARMADTISTTTTLKKVKEDLVAQTLSIYVPPENIKPGDIMIVASNGDSYVVKENCPEYGHITIHREGGSSNLEYFAQYSCIRGGLYTVHRTPFQKQTDSEKAEETFL